MEPKLCLFFWFLLLLHQRPSMSTPFLRSACRPGTVKECKEAKFIPGHTLLGEGIDIVTMGTTGSFLLDLQEVDTKCTICDNPHNKNILYKLPKAVVHWRPETSCPRNILSSVSRSTASVAEEATSVVKNDWKGGLNLNFDVNVKTVVGGSHSPMAKFANSKSVTGNYSFLTHKLECAFYSFHLGTNASLTLHFKSALKELPDTYDKNTQDKYRHLINSFGTHYITHVKVGGWAQELTAVRTWEVAMNGLKIDDVKDCLAVEAEVGISKVSVSSKLERCKSKLKEAGLKGDFHQAFSERIWKVIGGNATSDLLSPQKSTPAVFEKWMESLKTFPGLVSYSLDSIHNLVTMKGPKKNNLRLAISDYIKEKALPQKCSCPGGHVLSQGNDCSCIYKASRYTGPKCCTAHRGEARLFLTIKYATNLVNDVGSQADGYVVFRFGSVYIKSSTIMNNRNPVWNKRYYLGLVELNPIKKYTIEVWDKDVKYDDLEGRCRKTLKSGFTSESCRLKKGIFKYSLSVTCNKYLGGQFCQKYVKVPPRV